jgi:hypothetical protein
MIQEVERFKTNHGVIDSHVPLFKEDHRAYIRLTLMSNLRGPNGTVDFPQFFHLQPDGSIRDMDADIFGTVVATPHLLSTPVT